MKRRIAAPDCRTCHTRHGAGHKTRELAIGHSCFGCHNLPTWLGTQLAHIEDALRTDIAVMIGLVMFMASTVAWALVA